MKKKGEVKCRICKKNILKEDAFRVRLAYMCQGECYEIFIQNHIDNGRNRKRIEKKKKAKKKSDLTLTQEVFNRYIRARDSFPVGKCIACGREVRYGQQTCHAGHYYTRGARSDLRFNDKNVFAECANCNVYGDADTMTKFKENVIKRIGQEEFDKLSIRVNQDYSKEKLKEIRKKYAKKTRDLGC